MVLSSKAVCGTQPQNHPYNENPAGWKAIHRFQDIDKLSKRHRLQIHVLGGFSDGIRPKFMDTPSSGRDCFCPKTYLWDKRRE
jgi:hypothetical protein